MTCHLTECGRTLTDFLLWLPTTRYVKNHIYALTLYGNHTVPQQNPRALARKFLNDTSLVGHCSIKGYSDRCAALLQRMLPKVQVSGGMRFVHSDVTYFYVGDACPTVQQSVVPLYSQNPMTVNHSLSFVWSSVDRLAARAFRAWWRGFQQ